MKFIDMILAAHKTGSSYICNPPVTNTDIDWIILVSGYYDYVTALQEEGWVTSENDKYDRDFFTSFRKGAVNYIITEEDNFFYNFVCATEGAKSLNLLNKEDRIKLFDGILYRGKNQNFEVTVTRGRGRAPLKEFIMSHTGE